MPKFGGVRTPSTSAVNSFRSLAESQMKGHIGKNLSQSNKARLDHSAGRTQVHVDDLLVKFDDFMNNAWPKMLQKATMAFVALRFIITIILALLLQWVIGFTLHQTSAETSRTWWLWATTGVIILINSFIQRKSPVIALAKMIILVLSALAYYFSSIVGEGKGTDTQK